MPAYFSITMQYELDSILQNTVAELYAAIEKSGFSFKSGYLMDQESITLNEIVEWNQDLLNKRYLKDIYSDNKVDYKQVVFKSEYFSEVRGFWMLTKNELDFHLIIPEDDVLTEEGSGRFDRSKIELITDAIRIIWVNAKIDCVQTGLEFDEAGYDINEIKIKKDILCNPFAIIKNEYLNYIESKKLIGIKKVDLAKNSVLLVNEENYT